MGWLVNLFIYEYFPTGSSFQMSIEVLFALMFPQTSNYGQVTARCQNCTGSWIWRSSYTCGGPGTPVPPRLLGIRKTGLCQHDGAGKLISFVPSALLAVSFPHPTLTPASPASWVPLEHQGRRLASNPHPHAQFNITDLNKKRVPGNGQSLSAGKEIYLQNGISSTTVTAWWGKYGDRTLFLKPCIQPPLMHRQPGPRHQELSASASLLCGQQGDFTPFHSPSISTLILKTHPNGEWISFKKN